MPIKLLILAALLAAAFLGCSNRPPEEIEIASFNIDNLDGVITQSGIEFDSTVSSDGRGSIKITVPESTTVRLYETDDIDIEDARLIYRAKVKTENFTGRTYLEMWCGFSGQGEYFSRGLMSPVTGSVDWTTEETYFLLKKDQNPDYIKLNLVIAGTGTVWIDDIRLLKTALN
jgi:hypothetical protein